MNNLTLNKETMTLKEITDLLDVRHNDAMKTVAKMAKDESFGMTTEISYSYNLPNGGTKTLSTYQLDKRQSIAVASRLNTALLMKVIDRWQELEAKQNFMPAAVPMLTLEESLELNLKQARDTRMLRERVESLQIGGLHVCTELGSCQYFNVVAKIYSTNLGIDLGQNTLMEILRANGYLQIGRNVHERNLPYQRHTDKFRVMLDRDEISGAMKSTTVFTPTGIAYFAPKISKMLWDHENVKRLSKGLVPLPPGRY